MTSAKQVTAGKILKGFLNQFTDEPFGQQALILSLQLLELAFPKKDIKSIIQDDELRSLLTEAYLQYIWIDHLDDAKIENVLHRILKKEIDTFSISEKDFKTLFKETYENKQKSNPIDYEKTGFSLAGNIQSAQITRNALHKSLIETLSSYLNHLLIKDERTPGKIFQDILKNLEQIGKQTLNLTSFINVTRSLIEYKGFRLVSIDRCLPKISDLSIDLYEFSENIAQDSKIYVELVKNKFIEEFKEEFASPINELISYCQQKWQNGKLELDIYPLEIEIPTLRAFKGKIVKKLTALESQLQAGRNINLKDFEKITAEFSKIYSDLERRIISEFDKFGSTLNKEEINKPHWFKFQKLKKNGWILPDPEEANRKIKEVLTLDHVFSTKRLVFFKTREDKRIQSLFRKFGGLPFIYEEIVSQNFFDSQSPVLENKLKLTETDNEWSKDVQFIHDKRRKESILAVYEYLRLNCSRALETMLNDSLDIIKEIFLDVNPSLFLDEDDWTSPRYIQLFTIPQELLGEETDPKDVFGEEDFYYHKIDSDIHIGLKLKTLKGNGDDLFSLIVSDAVIDNQANFKEVIDIISRFAGFIDVKIIGNLGVCPKSLNLIMDLFI